MSNVPVPYYYNQMSAKERSYVDYIGEINKDIGSTIESNAKEINSAIVNAQIATSNAIYNNAQELKGTLMTGFSELQSGISDVSRELGVMGSSMNMGFALLNSAVERSSRAICNKLDDIYDTLKNPLYTGFNELYNRALKNYNYGLYGEVLEDLQEAIKKNKTDPRPHFLMGQTYLRGKNEDYNVIDLNKSIEALKDAITYIKPVAKNNPEVRPMAAEIWFTLGLAYHAKANDALHNSNETEYRQLLGEAKTAYGISWDYSQKMLESLYNLSRCKALFNETDEATQDLITVILKDHGYCIKAFLESDFDNKFKNKLYSQLKRELFPKAKPVFDRIQSIKAGFKAPYSPELTQLIRTYLTDIFTEDTPPFDMLKASVYFPKILQLLEKEKSDFEEKLRQEELDRRERELLNEKEKKERERRAEQEKREREEEERRRKKEEKEYKAAILKWHIIRGITLILAVLAILYVGISRINILRATGNGGWAIFWHLCIIVIFLIQYIFEITEIWPIIVIAILSWFAPFGGDLVEEAVTKSIISSVLIIVASIINKIINNEGRPSKPYSLR